MRMPVLQPTRQLRALREAARRLVDACLPRDVDAALRDLPAETWEPNQPDAYCFRCGQSVGPGEATVEGCARCRGRSMPWTRVFRLAPYDEPVDAWITAFKFHRHWTWGRWFADRLAEHIGTTPATTAAPDLRPVVCPVPLHWRRRWARGFNQSALIAHHLATHLQLPCMELLQRTRPTSPQVLLNHAGRQSNVRGAFAPARPFDLAGRPVWLVDDVLTTGATLRACIAGLKPCSPGPVTVVAAAVRDPRQHHSPA